MKYLLIFSLFLISCAKEEDANKINSLKKDSSIQMSECKTDELILPCYKQVCNVQFIIFQEGFAMSGKSVFDSDGLYTLENGCKINYIFPTVKEYVESIPQTNQPSFPQGNSWGWF